MADYIHTHPYAHVHTPCTRTAVGSSRYQYRSLYSNLRYMVYAIGGTPNLGEYVRAIPHPGSFMLPTHPAAPTANTRRASLPYEVWEGACCQYCTMRAELIGHFKPCMTDIYLHIDARMADYIRTHPYE